MSGFKNVLKEGWHPEGKGGKKESWRGDFKGLNQVAGWMGKGKEPSSEASEHVSRPLSSLKDPNAFGPPPKHVNYHGPAALPNESTPDRRGLGAPLPREQTAQYQQAHKEHEEESEKPKGPPVPYRVNTTGLSTDNLPPPPVRRLGTPDSADSGSRPSSRSTSRPTSIGAKPKPQLPPRVPPRNTTEIPRPPSPPPAYSGTPPPAIHGYVNQEATARLANAGVSVPALGIGGAQATGSTPATSPNVNMNELQSRFSNMRTSSASSASAAGQPIPSGNREDALPPPLSFRERHADKIDMGKEKWGGVSSRVNNFVEERKFSASANKRIPRPPGPSSVPSDSARRPAASSTSVASSAHSVQPSREGDLTAQAQQKKAPPPPPPKKADLRASSAQASAASAASPAPPPVPLSSKPR
ncbi:Uncharacterized protein PECH_007428 [Penicillium ucsense]|uniref:Uncharacterized protein n=1 Tax=Penicillium ucsense TaxID=2839758 RepID=A0A8J8WCR2_9EURO|nr:Uncharacterized protein PECM_000066 [Penicillium ucsense]KAF7734886.1 Uncharacterized protein PECH_007428 [Penicillium ucsense]